MKSYFFDLISEVTQRLPENFFFTASLSGEDSDFVRLNGAKVVQAGSVSQNCFSLDVVRGKKHGTFSFMLSSSLKKDRERLDELLKKICADIDSYDDDPFLLKSTEVKNTEGFIKADLPLASDATRMIMEAAQGLDFVGIHAQGIIRRGFANSLGQRNFIEQATFNTDFSVYHSKDKAIKASLAGRKFDENELLCKMEMVRSRLPVLKKPAKTIPRGKYRAFLAPAAVDEIFTLLKYGGFSEKQSRTKQSPLLMLQEGKRDLSPLIHIIENTENGFGPPFQSSGFMKPSKVSLIESGKWVGGLVSPKTAMEYGLQTNAANQSESPESLEMKAGQLASQEILSELGTGIYINNLWYLNYSDRLNAKMTGMTRFATFWVENGEIVAPVNVMRFDDSIYEMFGSSLEAVTKEREFILDQSTYEQRSTNSTHLPGILLNEISFTL